MLFPNGRQPDGNICPPEFFLKSEWPLGRDLLHEGKGRLHDWNALPPKGRSQIQGTEVRMTRIKTRRILRLEALENRSLLTAAGGPSPEALYMLELINQARTNPAAFAERVTSNLDANEEATLQHYNVDLNAAKSEIASSPPTSPLAWSDQLARSAVDHSQDQANTGVQSHTGSDGSSTEQRLDRVGYTNRVSDGENAYAYSQSVDQAMAAFGIDWGVPGQGHRNNLLKSDYRDVGIGIVQDNRPNFGPYVVTQDFGSQQNEKAKLIGVAFNDPNNINSYTPGLGRGDVTIDVTNKATGQTQSVDTWASGGYQIPLNPGVYTVTARVGDQIVRSQDVTIGTNNVEMDFNLSKPWQGTVVNPSQTPQTQAPTRFSESELISDALAAMHDNGWLTSWSTWSATKAV